MSSRPRQEGYRSRAVYKLLEIDAKHKILDKADRIIDLGAAPGGWSQISAKVSIPPMRIRSVVAIDFLEMDGLAGVKFLQMDFLDDAAPQALMDALGGAPDVVLSDMAAPTTGHRHRSPAHHASVRGGGAFRHRGADPRRPFPGQDLSGRYGERPADPAQAEFQDRSSTSSRRPRVPNRWRCSFWPRASRAAATPS
jgi:hypothetical protein